MKTLELEFVSGDGGFSQDPRIFKQIARSEFAAIYSRMTSEGRSEGFEVFKITVKKEGAECFGKIYEEDEEEYPSTGKFGKSAWAVVSEARAREIFEQLNKEAVEPTVEKLPLVIPDGEFTVTEFAAKNSVEYAQAFLWIKHNEPLGVIKFVREERRQAKGKMSKIYTKS
jgi:hypothetical protein